MDEFLEHASKDMAPGMAGSSHVLALNPGDKPEDIDPKQAIEIGYAVLMSKPIIALMLPGRGHNKGLVRIATHVIEIEHPITTPEGQAEMNAKLQAVLSGAKVTQEEWDQRHG